MSGMRGSAAKANGCGLQSLGMQPTSDLATGEKGLEE